MLYRLTSREEEVKQNADNISNLTTEKVSATIMLILDGKS